MTSISTTKAAAYCCLLLFFNSGTALAQNNNKVVVIPLGETQSKIARSGQTFTGQLAVTYAPNSTLGLSPLSFPVPLPDSTPTPTLEYVFNTTSDNCPQIGSSSPGVMCIYGYFETNIASVTATTGEDGLNRLHGYTLGVFPTNSTLQGFLIASWAYEVP